MNIGIDFSMIWVKLLAKKDNADMGDTSDYLKKEASKHYYFGLPEGWMGVDAPVKIKEESVVGMRKWSYPIVVLYYIITVVVVVV